MKLRRFAIPLVVTMAALSLGAIFSPRLAKESPRPESVHVAVEPMPRPALPWQPLSDPPSTHARVSRIFDSTTRRDRLEPLMVLADDPSEDVVARGLAQVAAARLLLRQGKSEQARARLEATSIDATALAPYAGYWVAKQIAKTHPADATSHLDRVVRMGEFSLRGDAILLYSELLQGRGDTPRATEWVAELAESSRDEDRAKALDRLAELHLEQGRTDDAIDALRRLYFDMPTQKLSASAGTRLERLSKTNPSDQGEDKRRHMERARKLSEAGQHADAEKQYRAIANDFSDIVDSEEMLLRRSVALYQRRRFAQALPLLSKIADPKWRPEAEYYLAEIDRRRRRLESYQKKALALLASYPDSPWAEETLFRLYRHYAGEDEPALSKRYLDELLQRFPRGKNFLEAQWDHLWLRYREGDYKYVATEAEKTAREFPGTFEISRFLYYGGRSYERAGLTGNAESLYHQVLLGFQNTYYGRRAYERLSVIRGAEALEALEVARRGIDLGDAFAVHRLPQQLRIAQLATIGLYDLAFDEAEHALSGEPDDPGFLAIAAWLHAKRGNNLSAIIALRDAFPFHIGATGDLIPEEIWKVFYPLSYQDSLFQYARERELDPYLVAGLIRQESTFNPRVRSRAGARGLMQIMPATGRQLARQERRNYRLAELYDPGVNIRYGTRYLKSLLDRFEGRVDYALAGYNAGPHRVRRWTGLDLTIDPEVFIEEIPFTETRNYVKLVLRNEMVYRKLYGSGLDQAALALSPAVDE